MDRSIEVNKFQIAKVYIRHTIPKREISYKCDAGVGEMWYTLKGVGLRNTF